MRAERLADGRGRLVAAGSTDALAEGLIELALSSSLRAEMGRQAYAYSREHAVAAKWRRAYEQIFARVARLSAQAEHAERSGGVGRGRPCLTGRSIRHVGSIWSR